jgi:uncharacterized protein
VATITGDTSGPVPSQAPREAALPAERRIESLDVVRGVALFGILLMNITGVALPGAYSNPKVYGGHEGADLWAWIITEVGFEGTMRGLFGLLFGAGIILFTAKLEAKGQPDAADIYYRRNLWLIGFGLVNAYLLLWGGDVLFWYGVTALFLYVFRRLPPKRLLAVGVGALVLAAAWNGVDTYRGLNAHAAAEEARAAQAAGQTLSREQQAAIGRWEGQRSGLEGNPQRVEAELNAMRGGYATAWWQNAQFASMMETWFLYRFFFDSFGMMLIGMALYKWGVLTLERPTRLYVAMAVGGYGIGLSVNAVETWWILSHDFSALSFLQTRVSYDLGRLPLAIGHLAAVLLFVRSGALGWLRRALAAVGQMALTSYLTHSAVCLVLFVGLGWYGTLARHELYYVVFAIWAAQLVVSPIWLRHYRFGPVEWLWRWLTYLKRPPFRRSSPAPRHASAIA